MSIATLKERKFGKNRVNTHENSLPTPTPELKSHGDSKNNRYIPKALQFRIWERDKQKCTNCGSQKNLNLDHIKPHALGGEANASNLRLLCWHCNQRAAIIHFGINKIHSSKRQMSRF